MYEEILSVYQKDNKYLILNPTVPAWIVTNEVGVLAVNLYCKTQSIDKIAEEFSKYNIHNSKNDIFHFIKKIQDTGLFIIKKGEKVHRPFLLSNIYLNMTSACNLKCIYCFAATRKEFGIENLSEQQYYKLLSDAKKINSNIVVNFTGGEPLLSDKTLEVAKYAKKLGFKTRILTNATLINDNNIDQIASLFDSFRISIDGSTQKKHEFYRGKNSYTKTVHAIKLLKEKGKIVRIAMVVTKQNREDVQAMNKKWGGMLTYQPLFPMGRACNLESPLALSGQEYYATLANCKNVTPFSGITEVIFRAKNLQSVTKCAIGDGELSISCTGDVYPCQLLHYKQFLLGNIKKQSLVDIYNSKKNEHFKNSTVEKNIKCCNCDFKYLCGGACQARHFSETGSIHKAGEFCEYEKEGIIDGLINNVEMEII